MEKILVADDEKTVRSVVSRALASRYKVKAVEDGAQAVAAALSERPDLILLDINMPMMNGWEALKRLRTNSSTQMVPVIMLTGDGSAETEVASFDRGADDYIPKPFDLPELTARVGGVLKRYQRALYANPLTRLPGGPAIEEEVGRRIRTEELFSLLYVDIDRFKSFNDAYGYAEGDRVIRELAGMFQTVSKQIGAPDDFIGHVGGDDMVLVTRPERAEDLAVKLASTFDQRVPGFYSEEDRRRGGVRWIDRQGQACFSRLMTLSIAVVSNERRRIAHYGKAVDVAAEIKRYLKGRESDWASAFLKDRRTEG